MRTFIKSLFVLIPDLDRYLSKYLSKSPLIEYNILPYNLLDLDRYLSKYDSTKVTFASDLKGYYRTGS